MWRTGPREGFEAYGRLDSRPFTGWKLNPYTEASFTLADSKIEQGINEDGESVAGNYIPEVPREFAYLTAGIESTAGWNASVSWIYRGAFFTDEDNTPYGGDPEGDDGEVPSVWLLAARVNYTPTPTRCSSSQARTSPTSFTSPTAKTASSRASAARSWPAPRSGVAKDLHR